jgi:hypothetical protein
VRTVIQPKNKTAAPAAPAAKTTVPTPGSKK